MRERRIEFENIPCLAILGPMGQYMERQPWRVALVLIDQHSGSGRKVRTKRLPSVV